MDFILVKRGRPKKVSEEFKTLIYQNFLDEREKKEKSLNGMQLRYTQNFFSAQVKKIIRKIPVTSGLPNTFKILPLVKLLEEAAKQFMMNETELIAASCVLNKVVELDFGVSKEELVFVICFAAKVQMENDEELMKRLYEKMTAEIKGFGESLKIILKVATFSVSDLVKEYKKFDLKMETVNYLYYVDDILSDSISFKSSRRLDSDKIKNIEKHKKSKKFLKEDNREIELKVEKGRFNRKCELNKKELTLKELFPMNKVENDELKHDQGRNDYLEFDINNFKNNELNQKESFDICDEFFQDATI